MSRFNVVRWILPSISLALTSSLVACGDNEVVQPSYQPPIYQPSQPQTSIDYSQQERYLRSQLDSAQKLCDEYTQKLHQSIQETGAPNAGYAGMQAFQCKLASEYELQLMQLQLQRQSGQ
jgi:hypothetical protein